MTVVVGYHGTDESQVALEQALELGALLEKRVVVVLAAARNGEDRTTTLSAQTRLWDRLARVEQAYEVRRADISLTIAENILNVADETTAEVIVIGLRGKTSRGLPAVGENAASILINAPCPVLTTTAVLAQKD